MKKLALIKDCTGFWELYEPILEKHSINVVPLDIFKDKDNERLLNEEWDGFIWRAKHDPKIRNLAKKTIYLFDKVLETKTFPSWDSYWHYDDKISQAYLFRKLKIPTPETFIFYNKEDAIDYVKNRTKFPLISKSSTGAGSSNVGLLKNKFQAKRYINKAFGKGIQTYFMEDLQKDYVYFQEFLSNNEGGYRIVCHSNRMLYGYFKYNDENSKFATGLGKIDFSPLPEELIQFVFNVHEKLGFPQVMSYDIFKDNNENYSVLEISTIYSGLDSFGKNIAAIKYEIIGNNEFKPMDCEVNYHEYFISNLLKDWGWS